MLALILVCDIPVFTSPGRGGGGLLGGGPDGLGGGGLDGGFPLAAVAGGADDGFC